MARVSEFFTANLNQEKKYIQSTLDISTSVTCISNN